MRVLIFNSLYPPLAIGGAERVVLQQVEAMREAGHEVVVLSSNGKCGVPSRGKLGVGDGAVVRVRTFNVYHFLNRSRRRWLRPIWHLLEAANPVMLRWARREVGIYMPDVVVISNFWGLSSSIYKSAPGVPVVAYLHDGSLLCLSGHMRHPDGRQCRGDLFPCSLLLPLRRRQTSRASALVTPSAFLANTHRSAGLFGGIPCAVLPNRVDGSASQAALRADGGRLEVVFVGRLSEHKGLDVLERLARDLPANTRLRVVGGGDSRGLTGLDHVQLDGERSETEVRDALRSSHVLVFPSICFENAPRTVLEAHAEGLGVVCFGLGGTPELVTDGVDGLVVDPVTDEALGQAIARLAADPSLTRSLQRGARRTAAERNTGASLVDILWALPTRGRC